MTKEEYDNLELGSRIVVGKSAKPARLIAKIPGKYKSRARCKFIYEISKIHGYRSYKKIFSTFQKS